MYRAATPWIFLDWSKGHLSLLKHLPCERNLQGAFFLASATIAALAVLGDRLPFDDLSFYFGGGGVPVFCLSLVVAEVEVTEIEPEAFL